MLDTICNILISPISDHNFMTRALMSLFCISVSAPITGVFLVLKRLSLSGDAISHAILPGAAIGFMVAGLSIPAMTIGGIFAGILVILCSALFSRLSKSPEDSQLAVFYLISLALGVLIVSMYGSSIDILHFLFGSPFAVSKPTLVLLSCISSFSLIITTIISRPLIIDSMDPLFFASVSKSGPIVHLIFMITAVMNLVAGFQAIGTLMSVGMMIIPAVSSIFWSTKLYKIFIISVISALFSSYIGLIISFHLNYPCSPAIILTLGCWYIFSFIFGSHKGLIFKLFHRKHFEA